MFTVSRRPEMRHFSSVALSKGGVNSRVARVFAEIGGGHNLVNRRFPAQLSGAILLYPPLQRGLDWATVRRFAASRSPQSQGPRHDVSPVPFGLSIFAHGAKSALEQSCALEEFCGRCR